MNVNIATFVSQCVLLSFLGALCVTVIAFFLLLKLGFPLLTVLVFMLAFSFTFYLTLHIPKVNQGIVRQEIEGNIFVLGGMLLTLLESGHSIVSAFEVIAESKAKGSRYFGQIASEIYLGKNLEPAIEDAIKYTPSDSFRRVLEPVKKSIMTGSDIQTPLVDNLKELSHQRIVDIENYQKALGPFSMVYMIFGTILPAIGIIFFVLIMSVMGIRLEFFPFLFMILLLIVFMHLIFIKVVQGLRPQVKL